MIVLLSYYRLAIKRYSALFLYKVKRKFSSIAESHFDVEFKMKVFSNFFERMENLSESLWSIPVSSEIFKKFFLFSLEYFFSN